MKERIISIVGLLVAIAGLFGLYYAGGLFAREPIAVVAQVLAALLMIWARITFGRRSFHAAANPTEGELVTWGPFRYVRNPIYAAIILFTAAGVADHPSLATAGGGLAVAAGMLARIFCEERLLREKYPEYEDYSRRTKRLVPYVF